MDDPFIEQLKTQIAQYQSMLEPLESGIFRIGEVHDGKLAADRTQAQIDHLKKVIGTLQAVVDRG
jgi:hypothetical protein